MRRVGLALSDALRVISQPLQTLKRPRTEEALIETLRALCEEHEVSEIVIGLPRHMDGHEGEGAVEARRIAALLEATGRKVALWDERMTTMSAQRALREMGVKREKQRAAVDQVAAQMILAGYLERTGLERP
jgi:putative Holliday junction resolvase